jgi:putative selenate reductase
MCSLCVSVCPNLAFMTYETDRLEARLPTLTVRGGALEAGAGRRFAVTQGLQVAVLTDFCNECGNCTTFCPTAGVPYRDKPRLYRDVGAFEGEHDNAFAIERRGERWAMRARVAGATHEIELDDGGRVLYRTPELRAVLRAGSLDLIAAELAGGALEGAALSLEPCATMYVLLQGVRRSHAHLPVVSRPAS